MSALPAREPAADRAAPGSIAAAQWAQIAGRSAAGGGDDAPLSAAGWPRSWPRPASTPRTNALRQFARWLITDAGLDSSRRRSAATTSRTTRCGSPPGPGPAARSITAETHRQRLRTVRAVLRADHRVGLARRPAPQPGHRRRHPETARAAAQVPRRPRRGPVHGRRPGQHRPPRPARRRTAGPHRHARRRAGRPRRRRGRADRRRPLAAHPARQAPQRPLRAAAPRAGRRCSPPGPPPTSSTSAPHQRLVADHRGPLDRLPHRPHRRTASAAPPACPACTPTGCATPWPPRPSTAACGWKPSPPCSATGRWR